MTNKLQAETKNRINMEHNIDILNKKIKTKGLNYDMQENKLKDLQQNCDDVVIKNEFRIGNEKYLGKGR
jgi:hypothetical protein